MELKRTIRKYTVSLDTDMGDGSTGCWVEYLGFSASLEALDSTGVLVDSHENEHRVDQKTIDQIRKWAENNGY